MDSGPLSGFDELLMARAVSSAIQMRHSAVFPGMIGNATAINKGNLHGHVRAERRRVGLAIGPARRSWRPYGDAALEGTRSFRCLPPMNGVWGSWRVVARHLGM